MNAVKFSFGESLSFRLILLRCSSTVLAEINKSCAISFDECPNFNIAHIFISVGESIGNRRDK